MGQTSNEAAKLQIVHNSLTKGARGLKMVRMSSASQTAHFLAKTHFGKQAKLQIVSTASRKGARGLKMVRMSSAPQTHFGKWVKLQTKLGNRPNFKSSLTPLNKL